MQRKLHAKTMSNYLTVQQYAQHFNISPWTVRNLIKKEEIAHIRIGRCVRIPKSEVENVEIVSNGGEAQ